MDRTPLLVLGIGNLLWADGGFSGGLTPEVAAALDAVVDRAVRQLTRWGFTPIRRPRPADDSLLGPGLGRETYEGERPSDADACRSGDRRFFPARWEL